MITNEVKYSKRIFAFLDILGFTRIVDESRRNPKLISSIANMFARSEQIAASSLKAKLTILQVNQIGYTHRVFSDTLIITGPYASHDDMSFLSMWIMFYQYLMWRERRTFVRGAMAFGDIYENRDVVFGPAFIDAYRLEKKASWPRILIDESLLNKLSETERTRDFHEFLRMNGDNLVYLDYLREIFHLFLIGENTRIQKKREQDFGSPIAIFSDHKEAILTQIQNALEEENIDEQRKILQKYKELSEYHNSTIFRLRQLIKDLMTNNAIVRELFYDQLKYAEAKKSGLNYKPKYGAEEHPEQADMLDILCTAMNRVIARKLKNGSYAQYGSPFWKQYEHINGIYRVPIQSLEMLNNKIQEDAINSICEEIPQELRTVDLELQKSIIDIGDLMLST